MEKRERRKWDLLAGESSLLLLLCVLFLAGGLLGCLCSGLADDRSAENLQTYLTDYLSLARDGGVGREFLASAWRQLRDMLVVLVLSATAVGVIGIPAVLCVRGFLMAFSVGCFCRVFGSMGLLPGVVLFALPALLWGPALFLVSFQGLRHARGLFLRGGESRLSTLFWVRAGIAAALLLVCAGMECVLLPELLRAVAGFVL